MYFVFENIVSRNSVRFIVFCLICYYGSCRHLHGRKRVDSFFMSHGHCVMLFMLG